MVTLKKYISITFLLLSIILPHKGYSQYFLYNTETTNIDLSFLKESVETESNKSFFNVITIKNNGVKSESFTLNISVPQGWKILGEDQQEIFINPQDSIIVPLRVSTHGRVKGDIGYSVIASITDSRGNTIKNEYCFVKIKSKEDLRISVPLGVNYFDQKTKLSNFSVNISNNGNKEELINFTFELDKGIGITEAFLESFSKDVTIPPYTDSTLHFTVRLNDNLIEGRESYRLALNATSPSRTYSSSVWFRSLKPAYNNYISPMDKMLIVELVAQGLMSEGRKPNYVVFAQGKTLLKNNNDIYYKYRNLSSKSPEDFYKYNQMYLGANINKWNIEIGDLFFNQESSLLGRGLTLGYNGDNLLIKTLANKNRRSDITNLAFLSTYSFFNRNKLELNILYNKEETRNIESIIASIGSRFKLGSHSFYTFLALNPLKRSINNTDNQFEYSGEIRYSSTYKRLRNSLRVRYATPIYYGHYKGRLIGNLNSYFEFNKTNRLNLFSVINNNTNPIFQEESILFNSINNNFSTRLLHSWDITPKVNFFYGPGFEQYTKNQISGDFLYDNLFQTRIYSGQTGARFRFDDPNTSLSTKITIGNVNVIDFPLLFGDNPGLYKQQRQYNIYYFDVNYRARKWYFIATYESGPRNIYSQFNYFYISRSTRTLRLMPTYTSFLYKNILHLDARVAFSNDMILKNSFINTSLLFTWYLPNDWTVKANTYYSVTNRNTDNGVETFQSLYLEAGIKKEINFAHPRVRYCDLTISIFKDFNGNYKKEPNEPGIRDVIVTLTRENTNSNERIPGDISNIELMSNYLGEVSFTDIPNGRYKVQFTPIGKDVGTFSKATEELTINLQEDKTEFFPFVEKNKVFGKIILNRSRLSGLGKVDVSNVRITATDSHGRSFSTLTNSNGEFTLFAPVTDEYIVTINNIFYENFDLRQNNFVVQFNGYKQFEVNFVFDEKVRRINFAATDSDLRTGIQQVRRTTISGTIKDANTQQPVRAKVNLINTRTNAVVTSTNSSATSGEYTMSFIAGDNYLLEVVADDYWYLSENLILQQVTTFMNINRDILLKPVTVGSSIDLNIRFDVNSSFLAPESVAELNRLIRQLKDNQTVRIEIQGHCDDLEALQQPGIALERANAVGKYLVENGFSNFELKSMGNTIPISSNETEEGRAQNRRVGIVVLSR